MERKFLISILFVVILTIFISSCARTELIEGQEISVKLEQKIDEVYCNINSGNFRSDNRIYEVWKSYDGPTYVIHTKDVLLTRHPPDQMDWTSETTDVIETSQQEEITGIVRAHSMNCPPIREYCNDKSCTVISK